MNDLRSLRDRASSTALLFDFDGTLSPTVPDPSAAAPADGVVQLLVELDARYRTVGVISGRPVAFLQAHLPPTLALSGQYGLEHVVGGQRVSVPEVERWRTVVAEAVLRAEDAGVPGAVVEPKGLSLTIHFRSNPTAEGPVRALVTRLAAETGLLPHDAKSSLELRPPLDRDKGVVVREMSAGATGVLYAGDDLGDLPALDAVRDLRGEGLIGVAVAVDGPELPTPVRAAADLVVPGQDGLQELMRSLLG